MHSSIFSPILFVLTLLNLQNCEGYRILGLFPLHAKSHFIMFEALMKGLASKGHQVDVVSTFPLQKPYPNYTDIIELPPMLPSMVNGLSYGSFVAMSSNTLYVLAGIMGNTVCEGLGHPEMQKLIHNPPNDPPYDLLITEFFVTNCFMAVGHKFKIPTIGVITSLQYPWLNSMVRNPHNAAFVPNNLLDYVAPMNFWERFQNTVYTALHDFYFRYLTRIQGDLIKKYVGDDVPGIREVENSLALVLINSHISVNGAKPKTTSVIEVGGLHIRDNVSEVSRDLKDWMDSSKAGFIYFSFGSMVTIESFPEETMLALYRSLGKISPIRVLVKIVDRTKLPPGLPKNIKTIDWAPQYQVLKHKNIVGFITHGGLMGTQEAIHCGVPMIGMPLFVDQFANVDLYTKKKIAVKLNYGNITEENMDHALNEILHNPVYKNEVTKMSQKFRDRPMSAIDTAIWWVEYIGRYGSDVLRSPAMDLAWWQVELLDVYAFLLLIATGVVYLVMKVLRIVVNLSADRVNVKNSKKTQ